MKKSESGRGPEYVPAKANLDHIFETKLKSGFSHLLILRCLGGVLSEYSCYYCYTSS